MLMANEIYNKKLGKRAGLRCGHTRAGSDLLELLRQGIQMGR
jgi:hypothetical protein